jgi:chaperonin GroES
MVSERSLGMKIKPLADRILVRRVEEEEVKKGGIIIPDTVKEKPQQGEVIAVGPGAVGEDGKRIALDVKKGDRILMGKYSGQEVELDGEKYIIMREDDVLAIIS